MKKTILLAALLPLFASAQSFTTCKIQSKGIATELCFQVPSETNVRYYLLEGSRDSLSFEVVERIEARNSGKRPQAYRFGLYDPSHSYYRVRQVDMSAASQYSAVVRREQAPVKQAVPGRQGTFAPALTLNGLLPR